MPSRPYNRQERIRQVPRAYEPSARTTSALSQLLEASPNHMHSQTELQAFIKEASTNQLRDIWTSVVESEYDHQNSELTSAGLKVYNDFDPQQTRTTGGVVMKLKIDDQTGVEYPSLRQNMRQKPMEPTRECLTQTNTSMYSTIHASNSPA
jgi:hypothetical protein